MFLLIYGGSASGKSAYAEERAVSLAAESDRSQDRLFYIAAMRPFGQEAQRRIDRHRRLRAGKGFRTIERYTDIGGLCAGSGAAGNISLTTAQERSSGPDCLDPEIFSSTILLECMSNLAANECFDSEGYLAGRGIPVEAFSGQAPAEKGASDRQAQILALGARTADWIVSGIARLRNEAENLVIVTLDVFGDIQSPADMDPGTQLYMECLGRVNRQLAQLADEVTEVVYSVPVTIRAAEGTRLSDHEGQMKENSI